MTPETLKSIRKGLGLTQQAFGLALGYSGKNVRAHICCMETAAKTRDGKVKAPISPAIARLAEMLDRHGVPDKWLKSER